MNFHSWTPLASAAFACAIAAASCGSPTGGGDIACSNDLRPAIEVDVFDARTGTPAAAGATVLLSGSAQDSVTAPSTSGALVIAKVWYEDRVKAGSYSVTVRKAGYSDWTQSDIRVQSDQCHVRTFERLAARLEPVAP
ncbi:MAG TPA: carboxypeptidase-like regulatory domain-containing protein [Gemmatimonadaceae bacterium]|nr:carboxypeptidase-like regulatory domain-containing protein [Gemmatimonadaceae bacterium]